MTRRDSGAVLGREEGGSNGKPVRFYDVVRLCSKHREFVETFEKRTGRRLPTIGFDGDRFRSLEPGKEAEETLAGFLVFVDEVVWKPILEGIADEFVRGSGEPEPKSVWPGVECEHGYDVCPKCDAETLREIREEKNR